MEDEKEARGYSVFMHFADGCCCYVEYYGFDTGGCYILSLLMLDTDLPLSTYTQIDDKF